MDRLQLRLTEFEDFVDILVNGVNFIERVETVERESDPTLAGSYGGFPWSLMTLSWSNVFDINRGSGAPIVLVCGCNVVGCWDLTAEVERDAQLVAWNRFFNPRRPAWKYDGLGPFKFDRTAYENEVNRMSGEMSQWLASLASRVQAPAVAPCRVLVTPPPSAQG